MHLRFLPSLLGFAGMAGAALLLTAEESDYGLAPLLFLTSGVLFGVVAIVDAAKARKSARERESQHVNATNPMSRSA